MGEGYKREAITGEKLFNCLKDKSIQKYERKAIRRLLKGESMGMPLKDKEKALLIKYKVGKAWIESDEYKKEQESEKNYQELLKKHGIDPDEIVTEEELKEWENSDSSKKRSK